jgi:uncharacterized protein (TIGR02246 family)
MRKFLSLLLLGASLSLASYTQAYANEATGAKQITKSINVEWNKRFNDGDSEGLAKLYSEDAILSPGNGAVLSGREAVKELFKSFIDNGVSNHQIETVNVYQQGDQIVQVANWQAQGSNEKGEVVTFGGVLMSVLVKTSGGEWVTQSHIWNMAN